MKSSVMRVTCALFTITTIGIISLTPTAIAPSSDVSVSLLVNGSVTFPFDEPAFAASCTLQVPQGANGTEILDEAVDEECLTDWDHEDFACCGRFVSSMTGPDLSEATEGRNTHDVKFLCGATGFTVSGPKTFSFWAFYVNGEDPGSGIDGYNAAAGDEVEFSYVVDTCAFANSLLFFAAGPPPVSPVLLEGNETTDPGAT